MKMLKEWVYLLIKSEYFKTWVERLKRIFNQFSIRIKKEPKVNKSLILFLSWISKNKMLSGIITISILLLPKLIISTPEVKYPEICHEKRVRIGNIHVDTPSEFGKLISEEDPTYSLAQNGLNLGYYKEYDDKALARIYIAKYERLIKQSGQHSADNFSQRIRQECRINYGFY